MLKIWARGDGGYVSQATASVTGTPRETIPRALPRSGGVDGALNRRYEGAGLGLPLTKALIELHGGTLDLRSEFGVGTTVTVRLPAERIVQLMNDTQSPNETDRKAG